MQIPCNLSLAGTCCRTGTALLHGKLRQAAAVAAAVVAAVTAAVVAAPELANFAVVPWLAAAPRVALGSHRR